MRKLNLLPFVVFLTGCGAGVTTYVHAPGDTTLGRVVVYRNGVAYFERTADVKEDHLDLQVPADKVDDFLKSLTVVDAQTGQPAPITYPTKPPVSSTGLIDMRIGLQKGGAHKLKLSYVTESPSWKPSYRVSLAPNGKVNLEAWAIVDNTSGEDWNDVKLGVGSSSALSFRFDLRSVRLVERETLQQNDLFAYAPPMGGAGYGNEAVQKKLVADIGDDAIAAAETEERAAKEPQADVRFSTSGAPVMHAPPPHVTGRGGGGAGGAHGLRTLGRRRDPFSKPRSSTTCSAWLARFRPRKTRCSSKDSPHQATETRTRRASRAPTRCASSSCATASTRTRSSPSDAASKSATTVACASSRPQRSTTRGTRRRRKTRMANQRGSRKIRLIPPTPSGRRTSSQAT